MRDIEILKQNPRRMLGNLKLGEVDSIKYAVDQITDEFMLYGLDASVSLQSVKTDYQLRFTFYALLITNYLENCIHYGVYTFAGNHIERGASVYFNYSCSYDRRNYCE
jgi:hypothetical protein